MQNTDDGFEFLVTIKKNFILENIPQFKRGIPNQSFVLHLDEPIVKSLKKLLLSA